MLQKIFKVSLEKIPPGIELSNSLNAGISKCVIGNLHLLKKSHTLPGGSGFIAALLNDYCAIYDCLECRFIRVQIIETPSTGDKEDTIHLFVTQDFLKHYNSKYEDTCFFRPVLCQSLERVIIGAKTPGSYSWFQNPEVHKKMVLQCCEKKLLCRQDDVFMASSSMLGEFSASDFVILDCQPLRQGLFNLTTTLVIVDLPEASLPSSRFSMSLVDRPDVLSVGKSALSLINYTNSNFLRLSLPNTSITSPFTPLNALKFLFMFEIRVISRLNGHFEKELVNIHKEVDPLNIIYVSSSISKKLKLTSGSWVKINLLESSKIKARSPLDALGIVPTEKVRSSELPYPMRLAQVCCFTDEKVSSHYFPSEKVVYMSPLLWFNLNRQPSVLMQPQLKLQIEPLDSKFSPPFATEAHANLVQSPQYDGKVNCSTMLSKYFETPRYICKGDIFCTDSRDQLDFHQTIQDEEHDKLKWSIVHFRISMIEGPSTPIGYLMSNRNTRLYQIGTKQCYVPITMEEYYTTSPSHPIWSSVPEGLKHYVYLLQDLILPFLKLQNEKCKLSSNILFSGPACSGKTTVIKAVCRCLNLHLYQISCHELVGEISAVIEARLKNKTDKGITYAPCVILLKNVHLIGKEKESGGEDSRVIHSLSGLLKNVNSYGSEWPVVVIGTTTEAKLNSGLQSAFLHNVQMKAPNEEERALLLQDLLSICEVGNDVSTRYLAQRTAGFVLGDLCALVNLAMKHAYSRIRTFVMKHGLSEEEEEDLILASVPVVQRDLMTALEKMHSKFAEALGAPKIPDVKFEDVGGLSDVKQEILDTIQLPLEHPEILFSGLRRSGVLLYGPPGSGKTMLAKAVATECSLNFLSVKGPELINMYVGQSEENVRAVFSQARSAVPCIIFFDELDSLAPNRGRSGDSGGVMDRVVSQLLSELDGLNKKSEVFVIGATNRPDLIDPALLRPGRFDRLLYVGIPEDKKSKLNILKALTRKIPLSEDVDLDEIIEKCPDHLSGADFYSLCSNAVIQRVEKNVEVVEKGEKTIEELDCAVQTEDFLCAMQTLVPSVSPEQFRQYQQLKAKIEND